MARPLPVFRPLNSYRPARSRLLGGLAALAAIAATTPPITSAAFALPAPTQPVLSAAENPPTTPAERPPSQNDATTRLATLATANGAARAAYAAKDLAGFLRHAEEAAGIAPELPNQLYNLACAQALNGRGDAAIATLRRLAGMGLSFDLAADTDFAALLARADFEAIQQQMATNAAAVVGASPRLFTLPERDLIAEGVAFDPTTGDYFVSAAYRRKIVRVHKDGDSYVAKDFVAEADSGLWGVTGIEVDPRRNQLWVCGSARPQARGGKPDEPRRAELVLYDLATATLISRHALAGGEPEHSCDTLTVGYEAAIYASDPHTGAVWRLDPRSIGSDKGPAELVPAGRLPSPQGLVIAPERDALYVADYSRGIFRVALPSGELTWLAAPTDLALSGIDGLELYQPATGPRQLIAIQNGINPHRILALDLDPTGTTITAGRVLAQNIPGWDEPTLGTIVGDELVYVGVSQWRHFDRDGKLATAALVEPAIYRLALTASAPAPPAPVSPPASPKASTTPAGASTAPR